MKSNTQLKNKLKKFTVQCSVDDIEAELAKRSYLDYVTYVWQNRSSPFIIGEPTRQIGETINFCFERFRNGISSTVIINCPPRVGKSDLVSRYLPPRFLGEFPDKEILNISHSFDKTVEFSRFARNLIQTPQYHNLYPDIELNSKNKAVKCWGILNQDEEVNGKLQSHGIKSGIAGIGADCLIIDDYHKNREEADSEKIRNKIWNEFCDGLLTRLAPVNILFILATRWHPDDITGRILDQDLLDIDKQIILPALSDQYESGTLFPERFSAELILKKKKQLGSYGFSSLYQQAPTLRGGNIFEVDKIIEVDEEPEIFKNEKSKRCWDLASSSNMGDFSVGVKGKVLVRNDFLYIYIDDVSRFQKKSTDRDKIIKDLAILENIQIGIEAFGAYKDTFNNIREVLKSICSIKKLHPPGSKEVKAQPLEAIMESGHFYIKKAKWNEDFKKEFREFPFSKHDDIVDATSLLYWINKQTQHNQYLNIQY